jgi:hypothetical protein
MKQMSINIPDAQISYNYLYETMPIDWREEDLLFVKLPSSYVIDVGWYPACDPSGRFKITLSDSAQNQIDAKSVFDIDEVVVAVENLADYAKRIGVPPKVTSMDAKPYIVLFDTTNSSSCVMSVYRGGDFSRAPNAATG